MTGEELQALRLMMREEIGSAIQASEQRTGEQFQTLREEIGSAIQASEQRTHETIGTAIQTSEQRTREEITASEQRTGERLDRIDGRMGRVEIRIARMDGRMDQMAAMQRDLRDEVVQVKKEMVEMKTDQREAISILDDATRAINSTQADQRALEIKDDESLHALRRDLQIFQDMCKHTFQTLEDNLGVTRSYVQALQDNMRTLTGGVNKFAMDFVEMNRITNDRLSYHEYSSLDETHPRPPQPGDAA